MFTTVQSIEQLTVSVAVRDQPGYPMRLAAGGSARLFRERIPASAERLPLVFLRGLRQACPLAADLPHYRLAPLVASLRPSRPRLLKRGKVRDDVGACLRRVHIARPRVEGQADSAQRAADARRFHARPNR